MTSRNRATFARRLLHLAGVCVLTAVPALAKHDGSYLRDLTRERVTEHLDWASPLAGGPLKAFFIVPRNLAAREVVELAQRLDIEFEAVTTATAGKLVHESIYESAVEGTSRYEKEQELLTKIKKHDYDVIVLGNYPLTSLPPEAQFHILRQIANGAGLVTVYPRTIPYKRVYRDAVPASELILALADPQGLPGPPEIPAPDLVKTWVFGQGRVVVLDYRQNHGAYYGGLSLTANTPYSTTWKTTYENNMALLTRAMLWAGGRLPEAPLTCSLAGNSVEGSMREKVTFRLPEGLPKGSTLRLRCRDAGNTVVWRHEHPLSGSEPRVEIRLPSLTAGIHFMDVALLGPDGALDTGYVRFVVDVDLPELSLSTDKESYEPGDNVQVRIGVASAPAGPARLRIELADSPYGRVWFRSEQAWPSGRTETTVAISAPDMPTVSGLISATLTAPDGTARRRQVRIFFPQRDIELFPWLAWGCVPGYLPPFYASTVVDDLGWRMGLSHPSKDGSNARLAAIFNQRFVPYMTRIGFQSQKDKKGWEKQYSWFFLPKEMREEVKALDGDESFYNPPVRELWRRGIQHRITNLPKLAPPIYTLGDENFFSHDLGFSPSSEKEYRRFLEKRYGTIARLNTEWGTPHANFVDVAHLNDKDARVVDNLPAWLDHRAFIEKEYADLHHFLAKCIKEIDPHARVGAEGSKAGNLEETIDGLEFWGPYSNPYLDEVLRSLGGEKIRMLWWGGYVGSHGGRQGMPYPVWRPLLLGTINGSAWYSSSVSSEGMVAVDLSPAGYVKKLLPHLRALQRGLAQFLVTTPLRNDRIAIRWSHTDNSACRFDERCLNPKDSSDVLQRYCYRKGLSFDYVSPRMISTGALVNRGILFLFGASCMSEAEAATIAEFARNGGIVVADINPAIRSEFGRMLETSRLADLFGIAVLRGGPKLEMQPVTAATEFGGRQLRIDAMSVRTAPGLPLLYVKRAGKGAAILLNVNLSAFESTPRDGASTDELLAGVLSAAGIAPVYTVSGAESAQNVLKIRSGKGFDLVGFLAPEDQRGKTVTFTAPERSYVYEADSGVVGWVQSWQAALETPFRLYTVFHNKPAKPVIKLDRKRVAPGEIVQLRLPKTPVGCIVRVELSSPDGVGLPLRTRVFRAGVDAGADRLRFAYTDAAGKYTVTVTDVRTGLKDTVKIRLVVPRIK